MTVNEIVTIISTVGFPIACCIFLIMTTSKEMAEMRKTVENNTKAILKLTSKLGVDADDE